MLTGIFILQQNLRVTLHLCLLIKEFFMTRTLRQVSSIWKNFLLKGFFKLILVLFRRVTVDTIVDTFGCCYVILANVLHNAK